MRSTLFSTSWRLSMTRRDEDILTAWLLMWSLAAVLMTLAYC